MDTHKFHLKFPENKPIYIVQLVQWGSIVLCCLSLGIHLAPISLFLPCLHPLILVVPQITLYFHLFWIPWSLCDPSALPCVLLPIPIFSDHLLTHLVTHPFMPHCFLMYYYSSLTYRLTYQITHPSMPHLLLMYCWPIWTTSNSI